jgi:hypothetical protein
MATRKEFSQQLEKAIKVASRLAPELLSRPGVVVVGPGVKRRNGKPTGEAAIVITVREKLSLDQIKDQGGQPLPEQLEGLPVDVIEYQKPVENKKTRQEIENAINIKKRVAASWLKEANITGIGVGYKVKGGQHTDIIAIQITVERKLSLAEVQSKGLKLVPHEFDNIPTDVMQAGPFKEVASPSGSLRGDRYDPLIGGLSISYASLPFHFGTLAAIAFDNANNHVALSNEHVLDGDIGETVHQPGQIYRNLDDTFEIGFQLDVCNPLDFIRIDTPNTLGGSILAGAAAAAALAAALSDDVEPTREGQQATPPAVGAKTLEEYTKARIKYSEFPLPGTPFKLDVDWKYIRKTDQGTLTHGDNPARQNQHVLHYHRLFVDRKLYDPSRTILLFGALLPPSSETITCKSYHCVALLRPLHLDQSYPVVLRSTRDITGGKQESTFFGLIQQFDIDEQEKEFLRANRDRLCIYYGEFSAANIPLGPWRHWMHVQTVNTVRPGTEPVTAAKTIGGLPVSNHYKKTVDVACGPFVFEDDGSFDIELF